MASDNSPFLFRLPRLVGVESEQPCPWAPGVG